MPQKQESLHMLSVRREARLKKLAETRPFIAGSLAKVGVRCGNPSCKCASGERHEAWVLTRKEKGRTVTVHVPRDMVEDVARWVEEHRKRKQLSKEVSELGERMIRLFVRASRGAARNRARVSRLPRTPSGKPSGTTPRTSSRG
ncbi:MAG: DUF6788 family protein [bacterium]